MWEDVGVIADLFSIYDNVSIAMDPYLGLIDAIRIHDEISLVTVDENAPGIQFMHPENEYRANFNECRFVKMSEPLNVGQLSKLSNNNVKLYDFGGRVQFYEIIVNGITEDIRENIYNFFRHESVNFYENEFWFIKENHTDFARVSLVDENGLDIPIRSGGLCNVRLLIKEVL